MKRNKQAEANRHNSVQETIGALDYDAPDAFEDPVTWEPVGAGATDDAWPTHLTQRLRLLLHAFPLFRIHTGDELRDPETQHYDALALALKVMDLIVDTSGTEHEMDRGQIAHHLGPLLNQMDAAKGVEPNATRHGAMVSYVLGKLRNESAGGQFYTEEYIDLSDGRADRRIVSIKLVEEWFSPDGRDVLRLSHQALNLFLNALNFDVEDAQAAAEALVRSQLARGRYQQATESARQARLQSIRYQRKIEDVLRQTKRDISRIDWRSEMPHLLIEARVHLDERQRVEREILELAQMRRDGSNLNSTDLQQIDTVFRLIENCRRRHVALHQPLMNARPTFLAEQERQALTPRVSLAGISLRDDILLPLLRMERTNADNLIASLDGVLLGVTSPSMLSWTDLMFWHFRPPRNESEGTWVEERDLAILDEEYAHYPDPIRARALVYLEPASLGESLLSTLLDQAQTAGEDPAVLELIALGTLRAFAPDQSTYTKHNESALCSHPTGLLLDKAGFHGDDLLLFSEASSPQAEVPENL